MRVPAALALLTTVAAQDVPRPTRLRIYEVRTSLRFDEGELQRVNFRYDRSSGIKSDIARSLVDVGLTTDRGFVFEVAFFGTEEPGQVKARCQLGIPDVAEMDLSDDDRDDIALRVAKDIARAADDGRLRAALAAHNFNGLSSAFDPDATANYALRDTISAPFPEETPKPSIAPAPAPGSGGGGGSGNDLTAVYALVAIVVVLVVIGLAYYAYRRGKKRARAEDELGSLAAFSRRSLERELALEEGRRFSAPARLVKDEDDHSPGLTPPELLRDSRDFGGSTSGGSRRSAPSQQLLRGFGGRPMDENWGRAGSVHSGSRRSAPLPARAPLARARTDPGYASAGSRRSGPRRPPPAPVRQASPRRNPLQPRPDPGYASGGSRRGGPRRPEHRGPAPARAASPMHGDRAEAPGGSRRPELTAQARRREGPRRPVPRPRPYSCLTSTDWRNGSASDSSPEGYVFESRIGHYTGWPRPTVHPQVPDAPRREFISPPRATSPTGAWGRRPNGEPAPGPHTPRGAVPPSRGFGGGELTPTTPPPRRQSQCPSFDFDSPSSVYRDGLPGVSPQASLHYVRQRSRA